MISPKNCLVNARVNNYTVPSEITTQLKKTGETGALKHAPVAYSGAMEKIAEDAEPNHLTSKLATAGTLESPSNKLVQDLMTSTLQYLSTASNATLGKIALTLALFAYLVLGNVGSILIGTVVGVVLHATWERQSSEDNSYTRTEKSLDISKRLLESREHVHNTDESLGLGDDMSIRNFENSKPETMAAIRELVDAIVRDYVDWWYKPILPNDTLFAAASHRTISRFILSIACHLHRKRAADSFLDFLTNSTSIIIVFLNEISAALTQSPGAIEDAVQSYLTANPESSLANVLDKENQTAKLRMMTTDLLQNFLEKSIYECDPARIFLTEIFGGLMLKTVLKTCSQPEWINYLIVQLLEKGESDLSQVIDVGVGHEVGQTQNIVNNIEGSYTHANVPKPSISASEKIKNNVKKQNRSNKALGELDEAAEEVKRLSNLIAEEEARKNASRPHNDGTNNNPENEALDSGDDQRPNFNKQDSSKEVPRSQQPSALLNISHPNSSFTSFDQIISHANPAGSRDSSLSLDRKINYPTFHNANIIVYDDSSNVERGRRLNKTNVNYLIQIEPASSDHPGWMIFRRYVDFETLHEILRRIAQVSGITTFTEQHPNLPSRKEYTQGHLKGELERYLRDACYHQQLADSEGMKRFLKKDDDQSAALAGQKNGFPGLGWPTPSAFESMGKGVLDVLSQAPKGVAEGGKAISGVFNNIGNLGQKKTNSTAVNQAEIQVSNRYSSVMLPRVDSMSSISSSRGRRASEDTTRLASIVERGYSKLSFTEQRSSNKTNPWDDNNQEHRSSRSASSSISSRRSTLSHDVISKALSHKDIPDFSPSHIDIESFSLPPPPSVIQDDYGSHQTHPAASTQKNQKDSTPLTDAETKVAVELIFAVINEMYTLSSAWNIRRTLLMAAKTYLLRPGNPSLSQIQSLIQDSMISANTSDAGLAAHLRQLRSSCLPIENEKKNSTPRISAEEKEQLRIKARKLLIERGVPTALMGVMGQAATAEAIGRVFDCLQVEELARGLVFGLLLQFVRAIAH